VTTPYDQLKQISQVLLKTAPRPLPDGCIREQVTRTNDMMFKLPGTDVDRLVRELEGAFNVSMGVGAVLEDPTDHLPWLVGKFGEIEAASGWRYWKRYARLLEEEKSWSPDVLDRTGKLIDQVLEQLEYPKRPGAWDRRGLVCGHVQSGKTAHYTGLICKAADAGYKLIVVIAGAHDDLRSQTQLRLDEGFLGYESSQIVRDGGMKPVGVGILDPGCQPPDTITNSTQNGDFNRAVADRFLIQPGGKPLLFVIKKNASVLKNLVRWVDFSAGHGHGPEGHPLVRGVPLLVIDDEADYASVDTGEGTVDEDGNPDPDHDPRAINGLIRKLLFHFEQKAYVGYTATPFANIFIHNKGKTDDHGEDLFPRSFIVNLPAPSNYVGPARVFGHDPDPDAGLEERDALPIIRHARDYQTWLPDKHKKDETPGNLPPSLKEALRAFVLTCAARRARGQVTVHNSMLVHVTRFVQVQERVAGQIRDEIDFIAQVLTRGEGETSGVLPALRELWDRDFVPTTRGVNRMRQEDEEEYPAIAWKKIEPHLVDAARWIKVRVINGTAGDALDYAKNEEQGLSVVAIGGDKLSRGLTLEGLSVSYYLRASKMYDTLMQMGRWFGYRPGYLDLCRLYTTDELIEWYEHISVASEELRMCFDQMAHAHATPLEYGLRVRCHPEMLITSGVKMRHGFPMEISYAGGISETISFLRDPEILRRNRQAIERFLAGLKGPPKREKPLAPAVWTGVSGETIIDEFLSLMTVPDDADKVRIPLLREYIQDRMRDGELKTWTVALISSSQEKTTHQIAGQKVGLLKRKHIGSELKADDSKTRYVIRRLVNPVDEMLDLDAAAQEKALKETRAAWQADSGRDQDKNEPERASGVVIRTLRPATAGLLLIYPLQPEEAKVAEIPFGFAISFPGSTRARKLQYKVNNIYWSQEYGGPG
jgi:hypothetical protein